MKCFIEHIVYSFVVEKNFSLVRNIIPPTKVQVTLDNEVSRNGYVAKMEVGFLFVE